MDNIHKDSDCNIDIADNAYKDSRNSDDIHGNSLGNVVDSILAVGSNDSDIQDDHNSHSHDGGESVQNSAVLSQSAVATKPMLS